MRVIGILEVGGDSDPAIVKAHGTYPEMIERWLRASGADFTLLRYDPRTGELPASVTDCDGWIMTGSDDTAYHRLPWMLRCEDFLRTMHAAQRPFFGICFGHQLFAQALGGMVEKAPQGLQIGLKEYDWQGERVVMPAYHFDQVVKAPEGAKVIATHPACSYAALAYGETALTVQGHPEFTPSYLRDLIAPKQEQQVMRTALTSLDTMMLNSSKAGEAAVKLLASG